MGRRKRLSGGLEDGGDALTAADAHGDERVASADTLQFVKGLGRDDGAGGAHGVSEREAPARVNPTGSVEFELLRDRAGLRREGFVQKTDSASIG